MPPLLQELVPWEEVPLAELGDTVGIVGFVSQPILLYLVFLFVLALFLSLLAFSVDTLSVSSAPLQSLLAQSLTSWLS